ncbi:MAG: AAA family ATPase [Bacteroidota bacterium]
MERARVAILSRDHYEGLKQVLPQKYLVVGKPDSSLEELSLLEPGLVLIGFQDFRRGLAKAEGLLQSLPAAAVLMVGPALEPQEVVEVMRAGVREVLDEKSDLQAALERAWVFQQRLRGATTGELTLPEGKVVLVHSPKGGSGKSTLALNLACALREAGQEVVLVDLSLHSGDLDFMLDVKPHVTWADLAQSEQFGSEELETALVRNPKGIPLLAAPARQEDAELVGSTVVERAIVQLRRRFPFVVVDSPPLLNETTFRVMDLADRILVPVPSNLPALRQVQRGITLWSRLGIQKERVSVVAWDQKGQITLDAVEKVLQRSVDFRLPYDPKGVEGALNSGEPIYCTEPRGAYAKSVLAIAEDLMGRSKEVEEKGLFGLLKHRRQTNVSTQQA